MVSTASARGSSGVNGFLDELLEKLDQMVRMEEAIKELIDKVDQVNNRIVAIEQTNALISQLKAKSFYTTEEAAAILDREQYTVRQWCNNGRIHAKKKPCGRGKRGEWNISTEEITRVRNEGLLPWDPARNRPDRQKLSREPY